MKKFALLCLSLLFCAQAGAANWTLINQNEFEAIYFDKGNVRNSGKHKVVWLLDSFKQEQRGPLGGPQNGKYSSNKRVYLFSCSERTSLLFYLISFEGEMTEGKPVFSQRFDDQSPAEVVPGSVGDSIMQVVCPKADGA